MFEEARRRIERIKVNTEQQKKQVVKELAKSLEEKIPTDTICIEITNQLRCKVSESFVRQCVEDKYKQSYRVKNAKKQKKGQMEQTAAYNDKILVPLPPLNQEVENDEVIVVEANGQALIQRDRDNDDDNNTTEDMAFQNIGDHALKEKTSTSISNQFHQKEQQSQVANENDIMKVEECPGCKMLHSENLELKEALQATQFSTGYKIKDNSIKYDEETTENKIMDFEFCKTYLDLSNYIRPFFPLGNKTMIWFSGKIDTVNGKVISVKWDRI